MVLNLLQESILPWIFIFCQFDFAFGALQSSRTSSEPLTKSSISLIFSSGVCILTGSVLVFVIFGGSTVASTVTVTSKSKSVFSKSISSCAALAFASVTAALDFSRSFSNGSNFFLSLRSFLAFLSRLSSAQYCLRIFFRYDFFLSFLSSKLASQAPLLSLQLIDLSLALVDVINARIHDCSCVNCTVYSSIGDSFERMRIPDFRDFINSRKEALQCANGKFMILSIAVGVDLDALHHSIMNAERISTRPAKLGGNIRDVAMDGGDVIKLGGNICEVAVDGGDVAVITDGDPMGKHTQISANNKLG